MNTIYLEHANITVGNLDAAVRFFSIAFPHFQKRGGGTANGRVWLHFGDDTTYLALNSTEEEQNISKDYQSSGVNHLGFVVPNAVEIAQRLEHAGYERSFPRQEEQFRIREYFYDSDGNEYEFVQYLSEVAAERNSYD